MKKLLVLMLVGVFLCAGMAWAETITFWTMPYAPEGPYLDWLEQVAGDFEAITGIHVDYEIVGWGDAWTKTSLGLIEPICDVTSIGNTWHGQYSASGGLEEFDIDEFGGADSWMEASLAYCTYEGKCYGVPWVAETRCLFYNKDMFAEAGVEPPTTWDELIAVGETIRDKIGEGRAFAMAGTNAWDLLHNWAILLWQNGGSLLNEDNTKATLNSAAGVEAMNWYVSLVGKGLADQACAEYNQPQADSAFINENAAMCYMGPWNIANILDENPDLNYGIVEPPVGPVGKGAFAGGSDLVVYANSEHKEAAIAWVKYLTGKQIMADFCKNLTKMLPPRLDVFEDPYYDVGVWTVFKDTLAYATPYPALAVWGTIENAVVGEFKSVLTAYINGTFSVQTTAKECLDRAAAKIDEALKKK